MKKKSKSATKKSVKSKATTSKKVKAGVTKKSAAKKAKPAKRPLKKAVKKATTAKKVTTKKVTSKKAGTAKKAKATGSATKKAAATKKTSRAKPASLKIAKPKRSKSMVRDENNIVPASSATTALTLYIGDQAPDLLLPGVGRDAMMSTIDLRHYVGNQPVVLYFYPKDDTPGCTKEACDLRDNWSRLQGLNVAVFGVSPDDVESHVRFAQKFELPFTLLADTSNQAANAYGVWVEKNMYGRKYFGVQRATFLINREGKIAAIWPKVSVEGHVDEVIETIERLQL